MLHHFLLMKKRLCVCVLTLHDFYALEVLLALEYPNFMPTRVCQKESRPVEIWMLKAEMERERLLLPMLYASILEHIW